MNTTTLPHDMPGLVVGDPPEWSEAECTVENSDGELFCLRSNADGVAKGSKPTDIADQQDSGRPCHQAMTEPTGDVASAPMYVRLVETVRVLPYQSVTVKVGVDSDGPYKTPLLFVPDKELRLKSGLTMSDAILQLSQGYTCHLISNFTGYTQCLGEGEIIRHIEVDIVEAPQIDDSCHPESNTFVVRSPMSEDHDHDQWRRRKLREMLTLPDLPAQERERLLDFLATLHHMFCLEVRERGETSMVRMDIDTGDSRPKRQAPRRMPFIVREEIARQLDNMQRNGVIIPSKSPWASPVVLVRKRDGTHRFYIDYRTLNSVTKPVSRCPGLMSC